MKEERKALPVYAFSFDGLPEDEMPIGGYIGPFGGYEHNGEKIASTVTDEQYGYVKECGLNFFAAMKQDYDANREETLLSLDLAAKYGVKLFIRDSALFALHLQEKRPPLPKAEFAARVANYKDHPAFAGIVGRDEPFGHEFPEVEAVQRRFNEVFEGTNFGLYMNANGYQCPQPWLSGGPEYVIKEDWTVAQYTEKYLNATHGAKFYSYDTYPFCYEDGHVRETYLMNLQLVRDMTTERGIPFFSFVQGGGYYDEDPHWFVPTEGGLTWNVTTSLAYGAKGIQYFPYSHPSEFTKPKSGICALVGRYGERTERWYYAKKINAHIKAIQSVLMRSGHAGIMANGESPCPIPENSTLKSYRELQSLSGDPAIVGCYDYKGKTALYVVNNSIDKQAEITLGFDGEYAFEITQGVEKCEKQGTNLTLHFGAGEAALVLVK